MAEFQERQEVITEAREQREHELALIKANRSEWAITARVVLVWLIVGVAVCFNIWATR